MFISISILLFSLPLYLSMYFPLLISLLDPDLVPIPVSVPVPVPTHISDPGHRPGPVVIKVNEYTIEYTKRTNLILV